MGRDLSRRECLTVLGGGLIAALCPACGQSPQDDSDPSPGPALKTGIVAGPIYKQHDAGPYHPDSPERLDAITTALAAPELAKGLAAIEPRQATERELALCHTRPYIDLAKQEAEAGRMRLSTGDTPICEKSFEVALWAAGGVLRAVDAVADGRVRNAFCAVRPPGHHASGARGMGFGVFNNIALAARYAQRTHKLPRVLIVDWDVHHGNGTQSIFYNDGSVFYCSTHQWPWYPGTGRAEETGAEAGIGSTLNIPLPPGAGRMEVLGGLESKLVPAADKFKPDLVLVSAGFDSRVGDPLGRLTLTDRDFADLTALVLGIAGRHAHGRLVSALEGGYDLEGLASAAAAHVKSLIGREKRFGPARV